MNESRKSEAERDYLLGYLKQELRQRLGEDTANQIIADAEESAKRSVARQEELRRERGQR